MPGRGACVAANAVTAMTVSGTGVMPRRQREAWAAVWRRCLGGRNDVFRPATSRVPGFQRGWNDGSHLGWNNVSGGGPSKWSRFCQLAERCPAGGIAMKTFWALCLAVAVLCAGGLAASAADQGPPPPAPYTPVPPPVEGIPQFTYSWQTLPLAAAAPAESLRLLPWPLRLCRPLRPQLSGLLLLAGVDRLLSCGSRLLRRRRRCCAAGLGLGFSRSFEVRTQVRKRRC